MLPPKEVFALRDALKMIGFRAAAQHAEEIYTFGHFRYIAPWIRRDVECFARYNQGQRIGPPLQVSEQYPWIGGLPKDPNYECPRKSWRERRAAA